MIDIHTHILPDFDDGASSEADSALMLRLAYENGTTDLIVTPHTINKYSNGNIKVEMYIKEAFDKLVALKQKNEIPINLYHGAENFGSVMFSERGTSEVIPLNNTNYVLLEFDFNDSFEHVKFVVRKILNLGFRVIIAHPERYEFVRMDPEPVHWFVEHDCLLQLNKGSAYGRFGQRGQIAADYILKNGFASFVASDAHDPFRRTPAMHKEYDYYCRHYGQEYADMLFTENARHILNNQNLQVNYF